MSTEPMYRIIWTTQTGESGHGEYRFTKSEATIWINYLREKYPLMTHLIEIDPHSSCAGGGGI